ncbi:hypothetical protein ACWKO8_002148 [Listeria monocytogenes]
MSNVLVRKDLRLKIEESVQLELKRLLKIMPSGYGRNMIFLFVI